MIGFNLNFDLSREVAEAMLAFTDETDKDASSLWQLYGIDTTSFAVFLTQ